MSEYGVRFRDGSVRHAWNGRTQRQRAEEELVRLREVLSGDGPHLALVERASREGSWTEVKEGNLMSDTMTALDRIRAVTSDVLKIHEGNGSTHYETCYRFHAGCLALLIHGLADDDKETER